MTFLFPLGLLMLVPVASLALAYVAAIVAVSATRFGSQLYRCSTRWCPGVRGGAGICPRSWWWPRSGWRLWQPPAPAAGSGAV